MSGKYPFVANFQIAFLRTFALDYAVISLHTNTVTYLVEKRLIFHEEINKRILKILSEYVFSLFEEKKIKFKKCARAILDSDNKMPSCLLSIYIYIYMYDLFHHVVWLSLVHPVNPQETCCTHGCQIINQNM